MVDTSGEWCGIAAPCCGGRCLHLSHRERSDRAAIRVRGYGLSRERGPLYLNIAENVRWKRLSALAGGHRPKRAAMSPDTPPATTVGEPGIFAVVTYDRTVAGSRSHEQGRLP